jgi:hypothetical protein
MVSTRRSIANAGSATNGGKKSNSTQSTNDTINVLPPGRKKHISTPVTPKASGIALAPSTAPSGNISDHDLSLTSPITDKNPDITMTTPKKQQDSSNLPERSVSSALRRLAPTPFGNMSGSLNNPIVVNENSSPPRPAVRVPKRKHPHQKIPEPHKFVDQGYGDLYNYRVSRAPLAAMPANGSTFTGHQSQDIYRMMNAKMVAAPDFSPNAAWGRDSRNVPFQVQYPISAQYLGKQQARPAQPSPYAQYYHHQALPNASPMVRSENEDMLRKKAVQYIREASRPSPRKRRLSDADPDETSADEAETAKVAVRALASKTTPAAKTPPQSALMELWGSYYPQSPQKKVPVKPVVYRDPDPHFDLKHLIEHTSLITSLLQAYPHSKDQKGLREDISMMMNVQNQHLVKWKTAESETFRKRRKPNGEGTSNVVQVARTAAATKVREEHDNALRYVFSANADMWQGGTGHGIADTFEAAPSSPAVASYAGSAPASPIKAEGTGGDIDSLGARPMSIEAEVTRESIALSSGSNRLHPKAKPASSSSKFKGFSSTSASHVDKPRSPVGKAADATDKVSEHVRKPATPDGIIASHATEDTPPPDDKPSTPTTKLSSSISKPPALRDKLSTTEKTPQPANALPTPRHKPSTPLPKRISPLAKSSANKLHRSTNEIPNSRDVTPTPTPSSSYRNSENSALQRPVFRFDRKAASSLQRQETTESIKEVDAEYRVLTREYLEAQGLGK